MRVIIWGLSYDIQSHTNKELTAYILFFAVICLLIGRFVNATNCSEDYFSLIRSKGYVHLWRKWWIKTIIFSFIVTTCAFLLFKALDLLLQWNVMHRGWQLSYFLWFLGICFMGMIFMLTQNYRYGQTMSFLIIICVEMFCVYMSERLYSISVVLIGNYVMLERSNYVTDGGYPLNIIIIILCVFIGCCGLFGNYIAFRRSKV